MLYVNLPLLYVMLLGLGTVRKTHLSQILPTMQRARLLRRFWSIEHTIVKNVALGILGMTFTFETCVVESVVMIVANNILSP